MTDNNGNMTPFGQQRSLMAIDPAAVAAGEAVKARIQAAYIMSYNSPRNIDQARAKILKFCESPEFAEAVEYAKPIAGTKIKGLSIRFAEVALATYGNILTEAQLLYEDDDIKRLRISALDLESNVQFSRDISIKKTVERKKLKGREDDLISKRLNSYDQTVYLLRATEDEVMTKESAWVSKFIRTEGLRLLPADIKNEAVARSRKTLSDRDKEDPSAAKKKVIDAFSGINIWPKDIEKYIGHGIDTVSPAEIADLRTVYAAIDSGEATWAKYVGEGIKTEPLPTGGNGSGSSAENIPKVKKEDESGNPPPEGVQTPKAFADIVKKETGKIFVFTESVDGVAHDNLSAYIELTAKNNNDMYPEDFMQGVAEPGVFPGFWSGFTNGTWKQHFKGTLPQKKASPAGAGPGPEVGKPEDGGTKSHNPFDVADWATSGLKKVGTQKYWDNNKSFWNASTDATKIAFREKWVRVFTDSGSLTKKFPPDEIAEKAQIDNAPPEDDAGAGNTAELDPDLTPDPNGSSDDHKTDPGGLDYGSLLAEAQIDNPEGLIEACVERGYGTNLVIPNAEPARKALYEIYLKISK